MTELFEQPVKGLTRRGILLAGGAGGALLLLSGRSGAPLVDPGLLPSGAKLPQGDTLEVFRAVDQLRLRLQLVNLRRKQQRLVRIKSGQPCYLRFYLPAQHVDEQAVETAGSTLQVEHRVAGETRVVLSVSPPLPFTLDALLDWSGLALLVDARGSLVPGGTYDTGAPSTNVTSLELPEGLILTPGTEARFDSQVIPVTRGEITEEWTARLGTYADGGVSQPTVNEPLMVRAIWTPKYPTAPAAITGSDPFTRPLSTVNRKHLVRAMGDSEDVTDYPLHEAALAKRVWLGATGGWLDLEATWEGSGLVAAWHHRAATGRDVSVTVVTRGFLAPFGIPASVATVSERTFAVDANGDSVAQLQQLEYLVVNEVPVTSPRPYAEDGERRSLFTQMTGSGTFRVTRGTINSGGNLDTRYAFLPLDATTGDPIKVPFTTTDRAERQVTFSMACPFVDIEHAFDTGAAGLPQRLIDYLNGASSQGDRDVPFGDQPVAFADEIVSGDGSTTMTTSSIVFSARGGAGEASPTELRAANQPAFYPTVELARIKDETAAALAGTPGASLEVTQAQDWIDHGNAAANFGAKFLSMTESSTLDFDGDASGLISPSFGMEQFGQVIGQSVSLPAAGATWDPAAALKGAGKIFGTIALDWLLDAFNVSSDLAGELRLPRFDFDLSGSAVPGVPAELCQRFDWEPTAKSVVVGGTRIFCVRSDLGTEGLSNPFSGATRLEFHLERCVSLDVDSAGEARDTVEFSLTNVALQFPPALPMIAVYVKRLSFAALPDAKADYDVDISSIELIGPLNFLDSLTDLLPDSLASFDVDILGDLVDVALDLALPNLSFGVFSMKNLHVGVGLEIPFGADPLTTTFSLGTRANPFSVTVLGIGGFGSIEIEAAPHPAGLVRVEVVLGVLLEIEINVVVARGSLSVGFSMALEVKKKDALNEATGELEQVDDTTLTATLDCVGEIEVLGLITITVEFLLALEYRVNQRLLIGEVTVTVEVDAAIVKKDVSFTVQQQFSLGDGGGARALGGAGRGPQPVGLSFADRYDSPTRWSDFCAAYA